MGRWVSRAMVTALVAGLLAFAISVLIVQAAQTAPTQPNVPVFTYGSE